MMRIHVTILFLCFLGFIVFVGCSQNPVPLLKTTTTPTTTAATTVPAWAQELSQPDNCSRGGTTNGQLRLTVQSVNTTNQIRAAKPDYGNRFVILDVLLEAITDFQLASSAVFWIEEESSITRTRSVATVFLPQPFEPVGLDRGQKLSGQIAFEISARAHELQLVYDPLLARQLMLCVSVP